MKIYIFILSLALFFAAACGLYDDMESLSGGKYDNPGLWFSRA